MYINVLAIVLRSERVGESDKRLSLFTRENGRLWALALGAGKPQARLAAATETCVESRFRLWMGAGQASARVTGGAVASGFPALRQTWSRMNTAFFLCEWMDRLTPLVESHPEKYDLLRRALHGLETADEAWVRLAFLIQFIVRAGYGLADALGPDFETRPPGLVAALREYDFTPFSVPPAWRENSSRLEEKLLQFVSPLLTGPLKTLAHRQSLEEYKERATLSGPRPS
jgi:hypothetical protein